MRRSKLPEHSTTSRTADRGLGAAMDLHNLFAQNFIIRHTTRTDCQCYFIDTKPRCREQSLVFQIHGQLPTYRRDDSTGKQDLGRAPGRWRSRYVVLHIAIGRTSHTSCSRSQSRSAPKPRPLIEKTLHRASHDQARKTGIGDSTTMRLQRNHTGPESK